MKFYLGDGLNMFASILCNLMCMDIFLHNPYQITGNEYSCEQEMESISNSEREEVEGKWRKTAEK